MFFDIINKWEKSDKKKEDKLILAHEIHQGLMDLKKMRIFLEDSIVDKIELSSQGLMLTIKKNKHEIKLYINEVDQEEMPISLICNGNYEEQETNIFCKLLEFYQNDKDVVLFDVGANVGWYSLNACKCMNNISVHAFEPSPITYQRLIENFKLNNIPIDKIHNLGFYKENGVLDFYYDKKRAGASSLKNIQEKDDIDIINVNMCMMDDWVRNNRIQSVDIIKCDVEGAELFVFEGGIETIKKYKPVVFSEMLRKWSAKFGYHPNDIIDLFEAIGYQCYVITENEMLRKFDRVDDTTVETNYFFLHNEKHEQIIKDLVED